MEPDERLLYIHKNLRTTADVEVAVTDLKELLPALAGYSSIESIVSSAIQLLQDGSIEPARERIGSASRAWRNRHMPGTQT